ncbi:hypothetical protein SO3561_00586 [Streptomyces olivochromogenes]|uniref:Uncharacterized protein n=1 Tax=Streptomyces olivochromogenes TaxID=1963 RepID=A0A250V549_STROL|nr:hypothetical protein SO3561_00586 [Streptomyces olivochromogenes]
MASRGGRECDDRAYDEPLPGRVVNDVTGQRPQDGVSPAR